MELEKTEGGREKQVFDVCNAYIKALLGKDENALEKALKVYDALGKSEK